MPTGKLNVNSPEILLNSWIDMNTRVWAERGTASEEEMASFLLTHILLLGESQGKTIEMFEWLQTRHADNCLSLAGEGSIGFYLMEKVHHLARIKDWAEEDILEELDEFTTRNYESLKHDLVLDQPVYVADHLINTTYEVLYAGN